MRFLQHTNTPLRCPSAEVPLDIPKLVVEDEKENLSEEGREEENDAVLLAAEKFLSEGEKAKGLPQKPQGKKKTKKTQAAKQAKIVEEIKLKKGWDKQILALVAGSS